MSGWPKPMPRPLPPRAWEKHHFDTIRAGVAGAPGYGYRGFCKPAGRHLFAESSGTPEGAKEYLERLLKAEGYTWDSMVWDMSHDEFIVPYAF